LKGNQPAKPEDSKAVPVGLSKEWEDELEKMRDLIYQVESVKVQTELYMQEKVDLMSESGDAKSRMADYKRKELEISMKIGTLDNLIRQKKNEELREISNQNAEANKSFKLIEKLGLGLKQQVQQ